MFLADARLSLATLALVGLMAGLIIGLGLPPRLGGALLALGCLAVLVEAVLREAHRRRPSGGSTDLRVGKRISPSSPEPR